MLTISYIILFPSSQEQTRNTTYMFLEFILTSHEKNKHSRYLLTAYPSKLTSVLYRYKIPINNIQCFGRGLRLKFHPSLKYKSQQTMNGGLSTKTNKKVKGFVQDVNGSRYNNITGAEKLFMV